MKVEKLTTDVFLSMWKRAFISVSENAGEFSRLDAITGDGDHGTAITQALNAVVDSLAKGTDFKSMNNDAGFNVMMKTSGSTGSLMGSFFLGMSDHSSGTELDIDGVKQMFKGGLDSVCKQTKAAVGDKTMMDALMPAVESILSSTSRDLKQIFREAADAAQKGAEATINMKANFGRARNYGERSVGSADPGASSWATIFKAFADF